MKVKTTHSVDVEIDGKIKTLKAGTHDLTDSVARKLIKTGAGREVQDTDKATKAAKAASNEA